MIKLRYFVLIVLGFGTGLSIIFSYNALNDYYSKSFLKNKILNSIVLKLNRGHCNKQNISNYENIFFKATVITLLIFFCLSTVYYEKIYEEIYFHYKSFTYNTKKEKYISASIDIEINENEYNKILTKRKEAIKKGFLIKDKKDYIFGNLIIDNKILKAQLRLKGDHVDHLTSKLWSYRIKLIDSTILGYNKFSIQSPKTRGYMCEWVFHQLLKQEGIIYLDYFFIPISINNKHKGVYAFEGHFNRTILIKSNRPNGPIMKFNEDHLWQAMLKGQGFNDTLLYKNAEIKFYNKKRSGDYKKINKTAKKLLLDYQNQTISADSIFDLNLWAKYIAIGNTLGTAHHLRWHNLRFYYNPKTSKIEPVGFDMSSWFNEDHWPHKESFEPFYDFFYRNKKFKSLLSNHLKRINNELYFYKFIESVNTELEFESKMIEIKNIKDSIIKYIRSNNEQ